MTLFFFIPQVLDFIFSVWPLLLHRSRTRTTWNKMGTISPHAAHVNAPHHFFFSFWHMAGTPLTSLTHVFLGLSVPGSNRKVFLRLHPYFIHICVSEAWRINRTYFRGIWECRPWLNKKVWCHLWWTWWATGSVIWSEISHWENILPV